MSFTKFDWKWVSKLYLPNSDWVWVYIDHRIEFWCGGGSEKPAAHTQQKFTQVALPGKGGGATLLRKSYLFKEARTYVGYVFESLVSTETI